MLIFAFYLASITFTQAYFFMILIWSTSFDLFTWISLLTHSRIPRSSVNTSYRLFAVVNVLFSMESYTSKLISFSSVGVNSPLGSDQTKCSVGTPSSGAFVSANYQQVENNRTKKKHQIENINLDLIPSWFHIFVKYLEFQVFCEFVAPMVGRWTCVLSRANENGQQIKEQLNRRLRCLSTCEKNKSSRFRQRTEVENLLRRSFHSQQRHQHQRLSNCYHRCDFSYHWVLASILIKSRIKSTFNSLSERLMA